MICRGVGRSKMASLRGAGGCYCRGCAPCSVVDVKGEEESCACSWLLKPEGQRICEPRQEQGKSKGRGREGKGREGTSNDGFVSSFAFVCTTFLQAIRAIRQQATTALEAWPAPPVINRPSIQHCPTTICTAAIWYNLLIQVYLIMEVPVAKTGCLLSEARVH